MEQQKRVYNQNQIPESTPFYTEEQFSEILVIPCEKPIVESIISAVVFPEVVHTKIIQTEVGKSNEGQIITGSKLYVTLKLKTKLTYITNEFIQSSQTTYFECLKGFFIVLPSEFKCHQICETIRLNKFIVTPYVEYIYPRLLDPRTIYTNVLLYIGVKLF